MDSLTQIVLGASVGEAVLGKKVGNKAMLWGAVAGTIPDLDVLTRSFTDIITAHEMHRGVTHSILFSVAMAPLFGWLVKKYERLFLSAFFVLMMAVFFLGRDTLIGQSLVLGVLGLLFFAAYKLKPNRDEVTTMDWSKLMFWSLITHPLLDAHTTWGTQLFWPFDLRVAYQNIFVVDPAYTVPFLVLVAIAMFYKRTEGKRTKLNNWALVISSIYMLLTLAFKGITAYQFDKSLQANNIEYVNMDTKPTPLNAILWTANVETKGAYYVGYYSMLDKDNDIKWGYYPKDHHLLGNLVNHDKVKRLIAISQNNYIVVKKDNQLFFNDLRFGQSGLDSMNDEFIFQYELLVTDGKLEVLEVERTFKEGGELLLKLLDRIGGKKG
jgi:inner membrane protein